MERPLGYTIRVQYCPKTQQYEAFSPSLTKIASDLQLASNTISYGPSVSIAAGLAEQQSNEILSELKLLGILPPDPDVFMEYQETDYYMKEKMNERY